MLDMEHGTERNRRTETTKPDRCGLGFGWEEVTVVERYCAHCGRWVEVRGVVGQLAWLGSHADGTCNGATS